MHSSVELKISRYCVGDELKSRVRTVSCSISYRWQFWLRFAYVSSVFPREQWALKYTTLFLAPTVPTKNNFLIFLHFLLPVFLQCLWVRFLCQFDSELLKFLGHLKAILGRWWTISKAGITTEHNIKAVVRPFHGSSTATIFFDVLKSAVYSTFHILTRNSIMSTVDKTLFTISET